MELYTIHNMQSKKSENPNYTHTTDTEIFDNKVLVKKAITIKELQLTPRSTKILERAFVTC